MRSLQAIMAVLIFGAGNLLSACGGGTTPGEPVALRDVAAAGDVIVAVGSVVGQGREGAPSRALIVTSTDAGKTWKEAAIDVKVPLTSITLGPGILVAVGGEQVTGADGVENEVHSVVLTSTDGLAWTQVAEPPGEALARVTFGGGRFVAVSEGGGLFISDDTEHWSPGPRGVVSPSCRLAFGEGVFMGCGVDSAMVRSTDRKTWTSVEPAGPMGVVSLDFANGGFLAGLGDSCEEDPCGSVGGLIRSADGQTWDEKPATTPGTPRAISGFQGVYAAATTSALLRSTDGVTWSLAEAPAGSGIESIAAGDEGFVAVGRDTILTSRDGATWSVAYQR